MPWLILKAGPLVAEYPVALSTLNKAREFDRKYRQEGETVEHFIGRIMAVFENLHAPQIPPARESPREKGQVSGLLLVMVLASIVLGFVMGPLQGISTIAGGIVGLVVMALNGSPWLAGAIAAATSFLFIMSPVLARAWIRRKMYKILKRSFEDGGPPGSAPVCKHNLPLYVRCPDCDRGGEA